MRPVAPLLLLLATSSIAWADPPTAPPNDDLAPPRSTLLQIHTADTRLQLVLEPPAHADPGTGRLVLCAGQCEVRIDLDPNKRYLFTGRDIMSSRHLGVDLLLPPPSPLVPAPAIPPVVRLAVEPGNIGTFTAGVLLTAGGAVCVPATAKEGSIDVIALVACSAGVLVGIPMIYFGTTRFTVETLPQPKRDIGTILVEGLAHGGRITF